MNKEVFDYLLREFEQCWSAEAHQAIENGEAEGDPLYIARTGAKNEVVTGVFREVGEEGVEYLTGILDRGNTDYRERAAVILGEIGNDVQVTPTVKEILTRRAEKELEACVSKRIRYSLEKLAG